MRTPIEILIEGRNEMNTIVKKTLKKLLPELEKYKGKKICKADGTLTKSAQGLNEFLPTMKRPDGTSYYISYFSFKYDSMYINFRFSKSGGSYDDSPSTAYCEYFQKEVSIANVPFRELVGVDDIEALIVHYDLNAKINLSDQKKKVAKYQVEEEKLRKLLSKIDPLVRQHYYLK